MTNSQPAEPKPGMSLSQVVESVTPQLWAWATRDALAMPERVCPPVARLWDGVDSYLGVPIANVMGYRTLRLDLHLPRQRPDAATGLPVVLYAPGGAWLLPFTHHGPWRFLLEHGFAVAVVEYRLSSEAVFPAPLYDVKAAIRWLRAAADLLGLDPARIGGWGSSAGGLLMALAGLTGGSDFDGDVGESLTTSSELACVITHYALTDLLSVGQDTQVAAARRGSGSSPVDLFLGGAAGEHSDLARRASPVEHVTDAAPPFLLVHGTGDSTVGHRQSVRLHEALAAAGAEAELRLIDGADHVDAAFDGLEPRAWTLAFVQRWLTQRQVSPG